MPTGSLLATPRTKKFAVVRGTKNTQPWLESTVIYPRHQTPKPTPWCGSCSLFFYFLSVAATEPETTDVGPGRVRRSTHIHERSILTVAARCRSSSLWVQELRAQLLRSFGQKIGLSLSPLEIQITKAEVSTTIFSCSWNLLTRFMLVGDARTNRLDGGKVNRKLFPGCGITCTRGCRATEETKELVDRQRVQAANKREFV